MLASLVYLLAASALLMAPPVQAQTEQGPTAGFWIVVGVASAAALVIIVMVVVWCCCPKRVVIYSDSASGQAAAAASSAKKTDGDNDNVEGLVPARALNQMRFNDPYQRLLGRVQAV